MTKAVSGAPSTGGHRRLVFWTLVGSTATASCTLLAYTLAANGFTWSEALLLGLFVPLFTFLSVAFWTAAFGGAVLVFGGRRFRLDRSAPAHWNCPKTRTAIIMPIHNEEVPRVFAGMKTIYESVQRTGCLAAFDFFVLSDATEPDKWIEEEMLWTRLCREVGGDGRIFYRRRPDNKGRKSGNIADFCERWGSHYDHMVVLDADSIMSGQTLVRLVAMMEAHPRAGIIQAPPRLVNSNSLFARIQQFANNLYSPIYVAGISFLQLRDGNYWGHNAIIRMRPFMEHCKLPVLPGRQPLGGEILSHDFVEAALIRKAGWEVWLAHDLDASYEESPPTLIDYAKRDLRWCAGNLQHVRLLLVRGLHPVSRVHLGMGAVSYALAPLWLMFLSVSLVAAIERANELPLYLFGESMFPVWPISHKTEAAILLSVTAVLIFLPKVFTVCLLAARRGGLRGYGGPIRATISLVLEILISMLVAPILAAFQTKAFIQVLMGRKPGWAAQVRRARRTALSEAIRAHATQTILGLLVGVIAWVYARDFFWWLLPVLIGFVLSIPISVLSSSVRLGHAVRRWGLFLTPEETQPTLQLFRFWRYLDRFRALLPEGGNRLSSFVRAVIDPQVNTMHRTLLRLSETPPAGTEQEVAAAVERCRRDGLFDLSEREKLVLLSDSDALGTLHRMAWVHGSVEYIRQVATLADRQRIPAPGHSPLPRRAAAG